MLISLKFIISDRLPKISYLTTLDRYLHTSYFVMILLISHVCLAQMKWNLQTNDSSLVLSSIHSFYIMLPNWAQELLAFEYEGYLAAFLFIGWTVIHLSMLNWLPASIFTFTLDRKKKETVAK